VRNQVVLFGARQTGVVVEFQLGSDNVVLVDRIQIQNVIFNLMRNTVEAMAETPSPVGMVGQLSHSAFAPTDPGVRTSRAWLFDHQ
jgi:C4-dicarboxylate-specific signal transduction histidine kinase